jgi:hypothetical protein
MIWVHGNLAGVLSHSWLLGANPKINTATSATAWKQLFIEASSVFAFLPTINLFTRPSIHITISRLLQDDN